MSLSHNPSHTASVPDTSKANDGANDDTDIESAAPSTVPHRHHLLVPGFNNPPPFLVFLHHNWFDIATQLFCLLISFLLYTLCPPLIPRYFPLYPGIEKTSWGMQHSQPYLHEYVNTMVSAIVSFVGPAMIMGAVALWGTRGFGDGNAAVSLYSCSLFLQTSYLHSPSMQSSANSTNAPQLIGLGYALSTATLFQSFIKIFIGGLRPHFLTICRPTIPPIIPGLPILPHSDLQFYTASQICTGPASRVKEAQMSFPSGHACAAFAGFGFLALWLNAKFKIFSRGGHFRNHYGTSERKGQGEEGERVQHWKLVLFMAPWCIAVLLALSKVRDGWHHPVDVVFGALVGTLFAHMAYKMVYRSVYDERTNHIPLGGDGGDKEKSGGKEM